MLSLVTKVVTGGSAVSASLVTAGYGVCTSEISEFSFFVQEQKADTMARVVNKHMGFLKIFMGVVLSWAVVAGANES